MKLKNKIVVTGTMILMLASLSCNKDYLEKYLEEYAKNINLSKYRAINGWLSDENKDNIVKKRKSRNFLAYPL